MQRRQFIEGLGIAGIGLWSSGLLASAPVARSMAVQLYSVREAVATNLEDTLHRLAAIGYNQLEIYGYNGTFFGRSPVEFKRILFKTGMSVISSHHVTGLSMKTRGSLTDGWEQAVEDLHNIGCKYMACSYLFPEERTQENYAALPNLLSKSGEQTQKAGIQFAYHNHDFEFEKYKDGLVYDHLLTSTSADLVKMELDLYWIVKAGHDPVVYFDKYPGRFPLWHVKDMEAGSGDITEVGRGTIDFNRIFAARKKAGLRHWFVEQDTTKGDMFESLKSSHDFLIKKGLR